MSTSHRGLPPPSAMTLPDPNRHPPPPPPPAHPASSMPSHSALGQQMPAPLPQWQGGEDAMRHWLSTKLEEERTKQEEEKRRQEEERSRQESLRLEQRIIEQSMLRESMQGGIPAHMIPVIFAGIGGPGLVSASVELLQQYAAQLQSNQEQSKIALDTSLTQTTDSRMAHPQPLHPFANSQQAHSAQPQPPPPPPPLSQHQTAFPAYGASGRLGPSGPSTAPRSAPGPSLSRLNTVDVAHPAGPATLHNIPPGVQPEHAPSSSPSIYFHHWVPPATQDAKSHHTPNSQPQHQPQQQRNEPPMMHATFASDVEMKDSPRKRKAVGGHGPIPPPSQTSPTYSSQSSTRSRGDSSGHMRSRSNKSNEDAPDAGRRPQSRRDSVATQLRTHEHVFGHDPHSRSQSHAGDRGGYYMR